jgi:hypothetical protein
MSFGLTGFLSYALFTDPTAPGHVYAGISNGEVWHATDYGETWHPLPFRLGVFTVRCFCCHSKDGGSYCVGYLDHPSKNPEFSAV